MSLNNLERDVKLNVKQIKKIINTHPKRQNQDLLCPNAGIVLKLSL